MHVSEDNIYGVDNIYGLVGPKDPVVLCDKCLEDLHFHNKYKWGGRREKRKEKGGGKKGKKTKPHHISGAEALRLSMACSSPKNKVRVLNVSLLKNCIHMSIVPVGNLCIICQICVSG